MAIKDDCTRQTEPAVSEASGGSPSVHPQETSTPFGYPSSYRHFLVSGCKDRIQVADDLYNLLDDRDGLHRIGQYRQCRERAWFVRHVTTGEIRVASTRCGLRWCPLCMRTKRFIMTRTIVPWILGHKKPKFITLTLKHSSALLSDQIDRLYNAFRLLRRSKSWKKHVRGGMWFFQIKRSDNDGGWHPHIHVIAEGSYYPQDELSKQWLRCTGDSPICHIEAVKDAKKTADYVARYATAPADLIKLPENDRIELFDVLHGRRVCGTFGTGSEIQLCPKACPDASDWEEVGTFWQVVSYRHNDDDANAIFKAWRSGGSTDATMIKPEPPPPVDADALQEEPVTYKQAVFEWSGFYRG